MVIAHNPNKIMGINTTQLLKIYPTINKFQKQFLLALLLNATTTPIWLEEVQSLRFPSLTL